MSYLQISDQDTVIAYGYPKISFTPNQLSIAAIPGMSAKITIPIPQTSQVKTDTYYRWNRIQFNYNKKHYVFLYNNCRDFDYYFKENSPD